MTKPADLSEKLFSYGTLQNESVQLDTFNRLLSGHKDQLNGYVLQDLVITDPHVIRVSGSSVHQILVPTNDIGQVVEGIVFDISQEELAKADSYEVDDYVRIRVTLASGTIAWVYAHVSTLKNEDSQKHELK